FGLSVPDTSPAVRLVWGPGGRHAGVHEKTPFTRCDRALERASSLARDRALGWVRRRLRRGACNYGIEAAPERRDRRVGTRREHDERPPGIPSGRAAPVPVPAHP